MRPPSMTTTAETESWTHPLIHDFLPDFATVAAVLALIWVACAIIATAGAYLAAIIFHATRTCLRPIRRRWTAEYGRLVTINPDGATSTLLNPRRTRRWHKPSTTNDNPPADADQDAT